MAFVVPLNEDPEYNGHDILTVMALIGTIEALKWFLKEEWNSLGERKEKVLWHAYKAENLEMAKYLMEGYGAVVGIDEYLLEDKGV